MRKRHAREMKEKDDRILFYKALATGAITLAGGAFIPGITEVVSTETA